MRYLVAALLLALPVLAWSFPARGHGEHDWMRTGNYHNPKTGIHCCSPHQDCTVVPVSKVKTTPDGFLLEETGETIPYSEAHKSEDENMWRCAASDFSTRCFFYVPPGY